MTLPLSALTQTSRSTTPFNSGAGIQETITGLNALGALVIGLGTNPDANIDPRQQLESISKLTGAINRTTTTIDNGTADKIAPGDPFYFQIASGFGASVANGVANAIQNAVTNVAVDIEVRASDPSVHLINHSGTRLNIGAGMTASFDIEFIGDGAPHRFDLQFVRAGTNVVLGSIPVVIGTNIVGDGYHWEDVEDGEHVEGDDFSDRSSSSLPTNMAPSFVKGSDQVVLEDSEATTVLQWATSISPGSASESHQVLNFLATTDHPELFSSVPSISPDGTLSFTPAPNAFGTAIVEVRLHDDGGTANGGVDTSAPQYLTISITSVNDLPTLSILGTTDGYQGVAGQLRGISLTANDSNDPSSSLFQYEVTWGDGGPVESYSGSSSLTVNHTYANSADVQVQVRVIDADNGASPWQSLSLSIQQVELQGSLLAVGGTPNDDLWVITPNALTSTIGIQLNGVSLGDAAIPEGQSKFFGGQGQDTLQVLGSNLDDAFDTSSSLTSVSGGAWNGVPLQLHSEQVELTRIVAGAGNDQIHVSNSAVEVQGGIGKDQLYGPSIDTQWQLTAPGIGSFHGNSFSGIEGIYGGDANDRFTFAEKGSISGEVAGGLGVDTFDYSLKTSAVSVSFLSSRATGATLFREVEEFIGGQSGADSLSAENTDNTWLVGIDGVTRLNKSIRIQGFESVRGGNAVDQFEIENGVSVAPSLFGGGGLDNLSYATWNKPVFVDRSLGIATAIPSIAQIESFVGGSQNDVLTGPTTSTTWTVLGLNQGTMGSSKFQSFEALIGGDGNDQFRMVGGKVDSILGGAGVDTLIGDSQANTWELRGTGRGLLNSSLAFDGIENITGGSQDDEVRIGVQGGLIGTLSGGQGVNTLDYSDWTSAMEIRGDLGTASQISKVASNFQILIGGSGSDTIQAFAVASVLVGNSGNDQLTGSALRRDLLIGGLGSDTLNGSGGDDILLGGSSAFDHDATVLKSLLQEWNTSRSYLQRVNNLRGTELYGTPLNGKNYLRNSPTDTIFDDGELDTMLGGGGRDWFLKSSTDSLVDLALGELLDDPSL